MIQATDAKDTIDINTLPMIVAYRGGEYVDSKERLHKLIGDELALPAVEELLRHMGVRLTSGGAPAMSASDAKLLDRYLDGPVIEGRVLDAEGRPVAAKVRLATRELHEGEEWKSRCRDGFFARWLESDGPQTVEVTVPGTDRIVTKAVEVKGRTKVTIQLPAAVPAATCPPRPSQ